MSFPGHVGHPGATGRGSDLDRHRDLMRARPWAPRHCRVRHRLSSEPTPTPIIDQGADMATATADNTQIIGGVDTHQDLHTAAVVSHDGTVLGTESFSTTRAGYRAMLRWFRSHGELLRVGVESTGTLRSRHHPTPGALGNPRARGDRAGRCCPSTRQARRSETPSRSRTWSMHWRRREGLTSFPGLPP